MHGTNMKIVPLCLTETKKYFYSFTAVLHTHHTMHIACLYTHYLLL